MKNLKPVELGINNFLKLCWLLACLFGRFLNIRKSIQWASAKQNTEVLASDTGARHPQPSPLLVSFSLPDDLYLVRDIIKSKVISVWSSLQKDYTYSSSAWFPIGGSENGKSVTVTEKPSVVSKVFVINCVGFFCVFRNILYRWTQNRGHLNSHFSDLTMNIQK